MSDGRIKISITVEADSSGLREALEALFHQLAMRELPKPDAPQTPFSRPESFIVQPFPRRRRS